MTYVASAIQIGFFCETGSQVEWAASSSFLHDPAAMKILFSGTTTVCMVGAILLIVSVLSTQYLYTIAGNVLHSASQVIVKSRSVLPPYTVSPVKRSRCRMLSPVVIFGVYLLFVRLARPSVPYNHLSSTLPFGLSAVFSKASEPCHPRNYPDYPFPELISLDKWQPSSSYYPS